MKRIKIERLFTDEKTLMLAYDQGLEHGPIDFDEHNVDPDYVIYIATNGKYNAFICQKGIAEKYHENYARKIPLVIKLNGKSNIPRIFPIAKQICSVKKAVELGADAVGYTIYVGSPLEPEIFKEFSSIQEEAHDYGLPVIAWMYPRGRFVTNELSTSMLAYSARIGLELGADILKIKYNDNAEEFKWVVKCAGKAKIVVAGGPKQPGAGFLRKVKDVMGTGAVGMAVGREVWQHESPIKMTAAIKSIIFENASVEQAVEYLK
ncbi:class I fructose-bisphosphate aldolase [Candidatus Woesearchaeota archaeon]|nr:class I fructose-bisphosphate aldolase [Candidatus Woesearchaeota archaeon]